MATNVKKTKRLPELSSGYFQTEIELLEAIATKTKSFNTLASYLAIARHGNGDPKNDDEPYRYSGSGLQSITNYVKIGEETARPHLNTLLEHGYIHTVPKEQIKQGEFFAKRYMLSHVDLNLCVPYALIEDTTLNNKVVDSALTRLQKKLTDDKTKLDALMILLNCYRADNFKMLDKGGLDPKTATYKKWTKRAIPKGNYQEWQLEPDSDSSYHQFVRRCLSYRIPSKQKELSESDKKDFWKAWEMLVKPSHMNGLALVYEAVTLFKDEQAVMTLRVNDFHADKPQEGIQETKDRVEVVEPVMSNLFLTNREIDQPKVITVKGRKGQTKKNADPSYMRVLDKHSGTMYQFYETANSPKYVGTEERKVDIGSLLEEGQVVIRVGLPNKIDITKHEIIGVYRPRFRPATDDVGKWKDREQANIKEISEQWLAF
jgi:hypothetical protein